MQAITPLVAADFRAPVQNMRYQLEILVGSSWVDIADLDGRSYLKSVSVDPGGSGPTPEVMGGSWSAEIYNEEGIFHPLHPTSLYVDYFRIGRQVRISIGGEFGGTTYLWPRIVGYMDAPKFDHQNRSVHIKGGDFSNVLADFALRSPNNYWGDIETFVTVATAEVLGSQQYAHTDAVRLSPETNSMSGWTAEDPPLLTSEAETGGGSLYVAQLAKAGSVYNHIAYIDGIGSVTAGKEYRITFKYCIVSGSESSEFRLRLYETGGYTKLMGGISGLNAWEWTEVTFLFTATGTGAIRVVAEDYDITTAACIIQWDVIDIREVTARTNTVYELPSSSNGPYFVTLDGDAVFFNDPADKYGWLYSETTRFLSFVNGVMVAAGLDLDVYYFETESLENMLADILAAAGLFADQAAALAAMDYDVTGITVDRPWFDAGTKAKEAVRMICERANYRFWFAADGTPCFKPAPEVVSSLSFDFESYRDIKPPSDEHDLSQVRNRVIIEGIEQGMFTVREDKEKSRLTGEASDPTAIATNQEHTEPIQNHLFQDQASITAMAATILAERKDPKLYTDLPLHANPVPLEVGDTIGWVVTLFAAAGGGGGVEIMLTGIIRSISLNMAAASYRVEVATHSATTEIEELFDESAGDVFDWQVPAGITSITLEGWGHGGGGGPRGENLSHEGGGGGGGGAHSRAAAAVTPGEELHIIYGQAGTYINTFTEIWRDWGGAGETCLLRAAFGETASGTDGGLGGLATDGIGDVLWDGGDGAPSDGENGGGGGSSAGREAAGNNANSIAGATAPSFGGDGGSGGLVDNNGDPGILPGGGGGGSGYGDNSAPAEGAGANGKVVISYNV